MERTAELYSVEKEIRGHPEDERREVRNAPSRIAHHPVNHIDELLPWNLATNPVEQSLHAA